MISKSVVRSARLLAVVAALTASSARANPWELFGFTPRAMGLGGTATALSDDLSGAYYNPAGMVGHTKTEFGFSLSSNVMALNIDRANPQSTISSSLPDTQYRAELGLIFPFGGVFKDYLVLGLTLGHPVGSLITVQTVDQSHPQFYMYQSKPERFASSVTFGVKIINGLSIGFGAQIIAEQIGSVKFNVDVAAKRFVSRDIDIELNTKPKPMASILIEPSDWLRIGFSWRMEAVLYYAQPTDLNLGDIGNINLNVDGYAQYWPHVFSLGVAFKPSKKWMITLQADYLLWANAPRDQVQVTIQPSGGVLDGLGLSDILGFSSVDAPTGFVNILQPRLAAEFYATDAITLRAGFWLRPAVTPDQTGSTNYLDNFSESLSAGFSYKFPDLLKVFSDPVTLDLAVSSIFANERSYTKKQATDPTGGASFGGSIWTFGAGLRYLY